jgi:hypothetical protein
MTGTGKGRTASVRSIEPRIVYTPVRASSKDRQEERVSGDPFADSAPRCRQGLASAVDEGSLCRPRRGSLSTTSSGLLMSCRKSLTRPRAHDLFCQSYLR